MSDEVLIDISQLVSWPARSGIQRLLCQLTRYWPSGQLPASACYQSGPDELLVVELGIVHDQIARLFEAGNLSTERGANWMRSELAPHVERTVIVRDRLPTGVGAYLLPEPTYDVHTIRRLRRLHAAGELVFAIVMDALPALKPWLFPGRHARVSDRYFRLIADLDHLAFISTTARENVEERLRRVRIPNAVVATLGGDGLIAPSEVQQGHWFVMLGTVERKKAVGIALDAFEILARAGVPESLVVVGAPGGDNETIERLRSPGLHVRWHPSAEDSEVARLVAGARATLFLGADEGFGLPPLEALSLGCPVIVSGSTPSLRDIPDWGQIRLDDVTPDSVADGVRHLAAPANNAAAREEVQRLDIPSWEDFAVRITYWIACTLANHRLD